MTNSLCIRYENNMKVIVSTGLGRLHLADVAACLANGGCDVRLICGYVPKHMPPSLVNAIGMLMRRKNLYHRLMLRCPVGLDINQIDSIFFADVIEAIRQIAGQFALPCWSDVLCWRVFCRSSLKYLTDANILHVRSGAGGSGVIERARERGMKVVVDHSIAHPRHIMDNLSAEYPFWPKRAKSFDTPFWDNVLDDCKNADVVVVNSEYVKRSLLKYGIGHTNVEVIYWPVSKNFSVNRSDASKRDRFKLIFTGSFCIRKGARLLLSAMEHFFKLKREVELHVFGVVDMPDDWIVRCEQLKIYLHGHVIHSELQKHLASADAYVFPTFSEGCARSVMEAMAAGLPVITTEDSGAPIDHLKSGYIIERGSIQSLIDGIEYAYSHRDESMNWGREAALHVERNLTEYIFTDELVSLYTTVLTK